MTLTPPFRRCLALFAVAVLFAAGMQGLPESSPGGDAYARAVRLRAALDATPRASRTSRQYATVMDAFRAVYHPDRSAPDADSSVEAVAELLAEEGRLLNNPSLLQTAVVQLDFLRRDFSASRYAVPALLTQGEIESRDLHDGAAARRYFEEFLRNYPGSPLAPQARAELRRVGGEPPRLTTPVQQAQFEASARNGDGSAPRSADSEAHASLPGSNRPAAPQQTYTPQGTPQSASRNAPQERDVPAGAAATPSANTPAAQAAPATPAASAQAPASIIGGVPVYRPHPSDPPNSSTQPVPTMARLHSGKQALVTGMRHWSTASYTRVAIDVAGDSGETVPFEASRVPNPDRIFFDLHGAHLAGDLAGRAIAVTDGGFLKRIRAGQSGDMVRVVLDVSDVSDYSAFWLPNPSRLIIDIHGKPQGAPQSIAGNPEGPPAPSTPPIAVSPQQAVQAAAPAPHTPGARDSAAGTPTVHSARAAAPGTFVAETTAPGATAQTEPRDGDSLAAIAALGRQPSRVRATAAPTTAPVAAAVADSGPAPHPASGTAAAPPITAKADTPPVRKPARHAPALPVSASNAPGPPATPGAVARAAEPDATGGRSMVRALGLKINRIVVDAGHGGHDSGTLGPGGLQEKDVVLDVALRLGKLLKARLGADVIYTRDDDTFIPLETRTAIANKSQADLFISVHANSSPDASARGVETYYLNFTASADALEVAARENAVSDESIHQLSDLVKKITLQDKIAESREFATDVEGSLYQGLETGNAGLRDRGVKKAPFVVLIGANMPSILAEISFLTNPDDASQLREGAYRQRIAESLYKGVARYERSLSGVHLEAAREESTATR